MKFWTYKKTSNIKDSSEKTKWKFKIPYILSVKIALLWDGWKIDGRFLFLWFYFYTDVNCGHRIRFDYFPWKYNLIVYNGWVSSLSFGFERNDYTIWKLIQKVKKMTPEEIKEFANRWNSIIAKIIPCLIIKK